MTDLVKKHELVSEKLQHMLRYVFRSRILYRVLVLYYVAHSTVLHSICLQVNVNQRLEAVTSSVEVNKTVLHCCFI